MSSGSSVIMNSSRTCDVSMLFSKTAQSTGPRRLGANERLKSPFASACDAGGPFPELISAR